jgi:uncharacterized protein YabE (DUF348 family)
VPSPISAPGENEVWSKVLEFLSGRTSRIAVSAAALTAVVGGTVAYANSDKTITLTVDGQSRTVEAGADTVQALLADEKIPVTARDIVAPAPGSSLEDGQEVVVRLARPLTVTVDGKEKQYWTTELTVDGALSALGIRSDGARLSASRSQALGRQGLELDVFTPKRVTVNADGKSRTGKTTAATVADLLAERELSVRSADRLSVRPTAPVTDGMVVALTRIDRKRAAVSEKVPFGTESTRTSSLYKGETKVVSDGTAGKRRVVYAMVYANGKLVSRKLVSSEVTKAPVAKVVQVGTKARPVAKRTSRSGGGGGSVAGADGLNWAALAECESSGNPRAVNPNGHYGLYQFSLSTWRSVGGSGNPIDASPSEQTYRAKVLYKKAGAGQWSCGHHLFR